MNEKTKLTDGLPTAERIPLQRSHPLHSTPSRTAFAIIVAAIAVLLVGPGLVSVRADSPVGPVTAVDSAFEADQAIHEIAVRDHSFDPEVVTITVGSIVRWTNVGAAVHTTTSDVGYWNWTLVPGASYAVRFLSPGTYPYHCILHRAMGMTGTIVVVPSTDPTMTPIPLPTGSPGEGQIVFDYFADETARSNTDLFIVQPDGSMKRQLTNTEDASEAQPSWSPDRRHVVYTARAVAPEGSPWQLWVVDVETGERTRITDGPEHYEPKWHPNGAMIAFTNVGRVGSVVTSSEIAVIAPDGTGMRSLLRLQSSTYGVVNPTWSPDGLHIAFTLTSNFSGGELYVMNADGSNVRRVFSHAGWNDIDPAWSPDGRYIAFASAPFRGGPMSHDIWLVDVRTGASGTIARHPTWDLRRPAWSPDGGTIVFNAEFETGPSRWALYLVPSRGGAVTGPVSVGVEPDWASASLLPLPTPIPGSTDTPVIPPTPIPFPTPTMPPPTPVDPTEPPPPPTFPVPIEPTPDPSTPTQTTIAPTLPPTEPTDPTPDVKVNAIYLSITYRNG